MDSKFILIITTAPSQELANEIARLVIARQVAACAQVQGPMLSVYNWKGKSEESKEWRIEIKTTTDLFSEVEEAIRLIHSYDVPEIIATSILNLSSDYAQWIINSVQAKY